jgi:hydrogenase expression/formation protein HypC
VVILAGHMACCEAKGVQREVNLLLLCDDRIRVGDHVLVHVGYAIQTMTAAEALAVWTLFDEIAAHFDRAGA